VHVKKQSIIPPTPSSRTSSSISNVSDGSHSSLISKTKRFNDGVVIKTFVKFETVRRRDILPVAQESLMHLSDASDCVLALVLVKVGFPPSRINRSVDTDLLHLGGENHCSGCMKRDAGYAIPIPC
jgi:hypothetical protein